jgi:serine/threonine protein kinase
VPATVDDPHATRSGTDPLGIRSFGSPGGPPPWTDPEAPRVAGYQVLGVLGRGGMGVVYKARHVALKRVVALKMILSGAHAGEDQLARFRAEAEAVARLQHPNIVQIYEVGEHDGLPYFSLEFVDGGSLARQLGGAPQPAARAAELTEGLARSVHYAHERGIVHRDLKPANVLLTADGAPKVTDFGLAKQIDSDSGQTHSGAVMGTPSYMAPEQAEGKIKEVGPLADLYALGAILYECLTGRPPFKGESLYDTLEQVRTQEPVPPSRLQGKVPRDLEIICLKCLRKEPHKRYASAAELADDLRRFRSGEPIRARPVPAWERALKWARRRPALAALYAVSAAAAVGVVVAVPLWLHLRGQAALTEAQAQEARADAAETRAAVAEKLAADRSQGDSLLREALATVERSQQARLGGREDEARRQLGTAHNLVLQVRQRLG